MAGLPLTVWELLVATDALHQRAAIPPSEKPNSSWIVSRSSNTLLPLFLVLCVGTCIHFWQSQLQMQMHGTIVRGVHNSMQCLLEQSDSKDEERFVEAYLRKKPTIAKYSHLLVHSHMNATRTIDALASKLRLECGISNHIQCTIGRISSDMWSTTM